MTGTPLHARGNYVLQLFEMLEQKARERFPINPTVIKSIAKTYLPIQKMNEEITKLTRNCPSRSKSPPLLNVLVKLTIMCGNETSRDGIDPAVMGEILKMERIPWGRYSSHSKNIEGNKNT